MKRTAQSRVKNVALRSKNEKQNSFLRGFILFYSIVPVLFICLLGYLFISVPVHAASGINKQINFQGKLVDNSGLNVADNTYTVVFSLYNVSSGGSAAWTETDSVSTSNGVFQVALGAVAPFPGNVDFNSDTWYLGIKVGADTEMTPRIRFSAVPYAFNAAALDGIVATNSATQFTITGGTNSLIDLTVNGSLTLGSTIKPTSVGALTIQSNGSNGLTLDTGGAAALSIGATANSITFGATNNPTYAFNGIGAVTFQGTSFTLGNGSPATIQTTSDAGLSLLSSGSGNITLGQNAGIGTVLVQPNAGGQAALIINDQGSGDIFTASASGSTKFAIANNGNVGIGTSATAPLTVLGNALITNAKVSGTVGSATQIITGDPNTKGLIIEGTSNTSNGFPSSNLISYYKFDENSGTSVGDSVVGTNGTWQGTLGSQWTTGKINSAGNFNGTNNYVNIPNKSSQNSYPFSISAWVKTTQNNANQSGIVSEYVSGSSNGFNLYIKNGHIFGWYLASSSNYIYNLATGDGVDGGAINDGNWHFVVFTVDSNGGKIYVDNLLQNTLAWVGTPTATSTTQALTLGNYVSGSFFTGQIDEVALWGKSLGTSDIATLYNSGSGLQYIASVQAANLQEWQNSSAAVLAAVSANGYIGIGTNTPVAGLEIDTGTLGGNAAGIINQTGSTSNDIFTASSSGSTKFTVSNAGTVSIASGQSYTGSGAVTLSSGGSSGLTLTSASGTVALTTGDVLQISRSGDPTGANGMIYYDSTAGKFKIVENVSGTPTIKTLCNTTDAGCGSGGAVTMQGAYNGGQTIDLSQAGAGLTIGTGIGTQNITFAPNAGGQAALVINDQGAGAILTASASGTTKLVLSHSGNLGVGSSNPQEAITVGSGSNIVTEMAAPSGVTASLTNTGSNALVNGNYFYKITATDGVGETIGSSETSVCTSASNQHTCALSWTAVTGAVSYKIYRTSTSGSYSGANFLTSVTTTSYSDDGTIASLTTGTPPSSTTAFVTRFAASGSSWLIGGNVGLGTTTPLARLHVSGGNTGGNAAEIIDQIGATANDILTGSASGTTKFSVANSGAIKIAGGQTSDIDTLTNTATLTIGGTSQNGLTLGRSGVTTTINGSGLTIGATSWTATPTISGLITATSGVSVAAGRSYTGAGAVTLSSGAGTTLTIDSGTTGALNIGTSANGKTITIGNTTANTALVFNTGGTGNIALGSNTGTGTVIIQPNAGGQAALIVKDNGVGDLLTASAGATPKFIVHNDGSIQVAGGASADLTTITGGNGLTITPKTNASGAGGALSLKAGNGTGAAGGGLTLDAGTGSTNGTISIGTTNQSGLTLGRSGALTTVNGSSVVLGAATSVSGAVTITSNSAAALTVGANGSTNPVFTVNASTGSVATGLQVLGAATGGTTALSVTDSGTNANLSIDAKGSGAITIGGTSTGNIIIGGAANGLTFSATAGPTYAGNGRPTKSIVLSAEYPGAVLTASGSAAISGNMTSDASSSAVTTTANNYENYYQWAATSLGSDQQYTIAVRVALPKDFSDWAVGNAITVDFNTPFTTSALDSLDVFIYKGGDTTGKPVAFSKANVSSVSKNWGQVTFTKTQLTSVAPSLTTAGQEAVFYLTLHSTNTANYVQVGDITLNYLAAF